jgi:hypothetical protein
MSFLSTYHFVNLTYDNDPISNQVVAPTVEFEARLNNGTAAPKGQVLVFCTVLFNEGNA